MHVPALSLQLTLVHPLLKETLGQQHTIKEVDYSDLTLLLISLPRKRK